MTTRKRDIITDPAELRALGKTKMSSEMRAQRRKADLSEPPRCGTCRRPCEWNVKAGITLCCGSPVLLFTPAYRTFE